MQKWICFALGLFSTLAIALFWMYPALLRLFGRGGSAGGYADGFTWSMPLLLLALLLSASFLSGFLALLLPELMIKILPEFLKKGLPPIEGKPTPEEVGFHFKNGRHFVLGSLAGKTLTWPAMICATLPIIAVFLGWSGVMSPWHGWMAQPFFKIIAMLMGGLFFIALLARLFTPGLLSIFDRQPISLDAENPFTAWPFLWGLGCASIFAVLLSVFGVLPHKAPHTRTADIVSPNPKAGDPVTDKDAVSLDAVNLKDAEHYVTWKGENFIPTDKPVCINGMSVFLPKDKGYVGHSLDPDSVTYDPYADKNGTLSLEGSAGGKDASGTGKVSDKASDSSSAVAAAESSMRDDAQAVGNHMPKKPDGIRDLGTPWGLGSYYYKGEEQLAGYDFPDQTRIFAAKAFVNTKGNDTETDALLVPGECGYGHTLGNGIRRQLLSNYEAAAHLVYPTGANHEFSRAPSIPQDVSDILLVLKNMDRAIAEQDGALDQTIKLIEARDADKPHKGEPVPPIIMVQRWTNAEEAENRRIEEEKLRKAIQRRLKSNSSWVHAGQLLPLCTDPTPACKALRNSLSIYVPRSRRK